MSAGMNHNIPDFERLFKSLEKQEKKIFKPFLKILAHSLQFLDKLNTLNGKMVSLKTELEMMQNKVNNEKTQLLEKQIIKLQKNCNDFISSEDRMKTQLKHLQDQNSSLETEVENAAGDILELK